MRFKRPRDNMLKQQLRTLNVSPKVVNWMAEVPREKFVPQKFSQFAYADIAIPLPCQEAMLSPHNVAQMLHGLTGQVGKVLVVGIESGYITALLAKRADHVYAIDTHASLLQAAQQRLSALGISNVTLECSNTMRGWDKHEPYNTIVITGSLPFIPKIFLKNLSKSGRIFAIIGNSPVMQAVIAKRGHRQRVIERLFETDHPRLSSAIKPKGFVF